MSQTFATMDRDEILYISPITDFGFKKCFRDEIVMKGFLTALFESAGIEMNIVSITYLNNEEDGDTEASRRVIFDLRCKLDTGEEIIIEMQNERQSFIKERMVYYVARGIANQGDIITRRGKSITRKEKKKWNYDIKKVIGVFLLNFKLPGEESTKVARHCLVNMNKKQKHISSDKLELWTIQLPYYRKRKIKPEDCKTKLDYWLYNIANMDKMKTTMPFTDRSEAIARFNDLARFHALPVKEQDRYMREYDDCVVIEDVINLRINEAVNKAIAKTEKRIEKREKKKAAIEIAYKLKSKGNSVEYIAEITGLSPEEIEKL